MRFLRKNKLVSILTPCYNGAKVIHRLLDSVLQQDYPYIEMIIVDDGSIDNSKYVISHYQEEFERKGYLLLYIYQENKGQAAAINNGLKKVSGEYLIWPDCDDYFSLPTSISTFVGEFCNLSEEYGAVRCAANYVDEKDLSLRFVRYHKVLNEKIFVDFFNGMESIAIAGMCMVRMSAFDKMNPNRSIYDECHPQNWQILLPIMYEFKCKTINVPLHTVVIGNTSDSRTPKSLNQHLAGFDGYLQILIHTIQRIDMPTEKKDKYLQICLKRNLQEKIEYSLLYYNKEKAVLFAKELREMGERITKGQRLKIAVLKISPCLLRLLMKTNGYVLNRCRSRK